MPTALPQLLLTHQIFHQFLHKELIMAKKAAPKMPEKKETKAHEKKESKSMQKKESKKGKC